uniref:Uncharacterized protein n=1 Tax=Chrysotila carterae TaxID=13221 RepID=A0A6T0DH29_CHRCT|mmetsp:Transcript_5296/g.10291  ORF Transcript_5296/g.10291 Transcript_5296/m.10291 type:complete len:161 (+) Transcript_5296:440-922(+)
MQMGRLIYSRFRKSRHRSAGAHVDFHPLMTSTLSVTVLEDERVAEIEAQLAEQRDLIGILRELLQHIEAGGDEEALLCSATFSQLLRRLSAAQQRQRELLSSAVSTAIRQKYPALLEQSRDILELLSELTSGNRSRPPAAHAAPPAASSDFARTPVANII